MSIKNPSGKHVVIVGGGAVGSAIAYFLTHLEPGIQVTVIERDSSYREASSALSGSSIRQQFSSPINMALSGFGIEFMRNIGELLRVGDDSPDIGLVEDGYLYLANAAQAGQMRANHAIQLENNVHVALLAPEELHARFPWLNVDEVVLGSLGLSGEGWFDGYALLHAFRKKGISQGVRFVQDEATGFVSATVKGATRIQAVQLKCGADIPCDAVVNAAGAWCRRVAAWLNIDLPVYARRRTIFNFTSPAQLGKSPLVIDTSGIWMRREGHGFIAGFSPAEADDANDLPLDPEHAAFDNHIWPSLATRIPAFEAVRLKSAWAGYYEMNVFDHNAIVGTHPACGNLYFANGFSGHGLQQCPAVGRGMAELIVTGGWQTLDLDPIRFDRILAGRPLLEQNVI